MFGKQSLQPFKYYNCSK